ncbi:MAG: hypothetical protein JHC54_11285 [Acinetobacter sp.]|nr:hypothetical protein [Acinetobacter sp.]
MATVTTHTREFRNRKIQYRSDLVVFYDNNGQAELPDDQAIRLSGIDESVSIDYTVDTSTEKTPPPPPPVNPEDDAKKAVDFTAMSLEDLKVLAAQAVLPAAQWQNIKKKEVMIAYLSEVLRES